MAGLRGTEQVRWHGHGLNTGLVFGMARWGVDHFPRPLSAAIGHSGSWLLFRLSAATRMALVGNQRTVAPGLTERGRRELALRTLRTYATEVTDLFRSFSMSREQLSAFESADTSLRTLAQAASKGGALLVTGHLGNLELGAVLLRAVYGLRLTVVVMAEPDPEVNAHRHQMRAAVGIDTLEVRDAADTALEIRKRLADGQIIVLVCDRALGRDRIEVEFFGRPTPFLRSPAILAYLTGAPLVPTFILRQPDGRYLGLSDEPIVVTRDGGLEGNVQAAMQRFATILERKVADYPHLWYQFYPYWGASS